MGRERLGIATRILVDNLFLKKIIFTGVILKEVHLRKKKKNTPNTLPHLAADSGVEILN